MENCVALETLQPKSIVETGYMGPWGLCSTSKDTRQEVDIPLRRQCTDQEKTMPYSVGKPRNWITQRLR